jgi:hypothetical protein
MARDRRQTPAVRDIDADITGVDGRTRGTEVIITVGVTNRHILVTFMSQFAQDGTGPLIDSH